jgi:hypothetical protein
MTKTGSKAGRHGTPADTTEAVDACMRELAHPFKAEIQQIRELILAAAPGVAEGVKWKAPSFRTHEYFATINLREKQGIGVILHLGAKVRDMSPGGLSISDPDGLLKWLAADRASICFTSNSDLQERRAAFSQVVSDWVRHV